MFMLWQSKGQGLVGSQCPGTGAKIGRATPILMDRACHSRSPPVMATLLSPTIASLLAGPSARPTVEHSFAKHIRALPLYLPIFAYSLLGDI